MKVVIFNCLKCSKSHKKHFNKYLIKRFANIYEFCNRGINKYCLMLRKDVYPYENKYSWKRFDGTSLPKKEHCYSNLNIEDITDADYKHAVKSMEKILNK